MKRNKAARDCCSSPRASVHDLGDTRIIPCDVLLGVLGALMIVGIPFAMALMKQFGWW